MNDLLEWAVELAKRLGASYADARYQSLSSTIVGAENGVLESYESQKLLGIGVRVLVEGAWGFASTNQLTKQAVRERVGSAIRMASASAPNADKSELAEVKPVRDKVSGKVKISPEDVGPDEVVDLLLSANKAARISERIKSSATNLGFIRDQRIFVSTEESKVEVDVTLTGMSHLSVAAENGVMERVAHGKSLCAGYEFLKHQDWLKFTAELSDVAAKAVKAKPPSAGVYEVIADPDLIGLFLHEALGHASEGDLVASGASVLRGRLGQPLASELVTVVDDGKIEGGFFVPYDDEGVPKASTTLIENGMLKTHLSSRRTAWQLDIAPSGNGRAQDFENTPIVRQTNVYMKPGDYSFEELVEGVKRGFYLLGRGAGGGQVDVGGGTFTFALGPSFAIENGRLCDLVRGSTVSGSVLETMKTIDGVGKDLKITTTVFGGCGKDGQLAKVGQGGPPR